MGTQGAPPPPKEAPESEDERARGADQALSDRDQALSDNDQTLSDHDQTLSDRDQQASDDDQATSAREGEHGVDAAAHERTTAMRAETSRERVETGGSREGAAGERDRAAQQRDDLAARRDQAEDLGDLEALRLDGRDDHLDRHTPTAQELRAVATGGAPARRRGPSARGEEPRAGRTRPRAGGPRPRARCAGPRAGATDELTGALRRGAGREALQHEIDRARRTGEALTVAYVDVDDLKSVNDREGHGAGDQVLRDVADAMRRHTRSYDLVMRLGGDEFLCVLPGIGPSEARQRFEKLSPELGEGSSVTFGLSELREHESPQELIDRADSDLLAVRRGAGSDRA